MKKYDGKRLQEALKVDEFGPNILGHDILKLLNYFWKGKNF